MRTAIYGAGAMGTVLGAFISKSGKEIDLISRNKDHVKKLKESGAKIVGEVEFTQKVNAFTPDEMTGKYDVILLMTKQRENKSILQFLLNYLEEDGVVCTLQNGLPEPSVAEVVGAERCFGCAVTWGARLVESGVAELTSKPDKMSFSLGHYENKSNKIRAIKNILQCAGTVTIEQNFFGARWTKLAINAAFSSLSAITGLTFGEISKDKRLGKLALAIMNETFTVAEKVGIEPEKMQGHDIKGIYGYKNKFQRWKARLLLPYLTAKHKNIVSGMYYDLNAGRKCDIDYINGVVSHLGKKFGVATPVCDKAIEIIHSIEDGTREIATENVNLF